MGNEQITAILVVLLVCGAVYVLRRKGLLRASVSLPRVTRSRLMQSVERVSLGGQHSLHLVRVADRHILVAVSPTGCTLLESGLSSARSDVEGAR